jgi:citrate lyase beta subunit
LDSLAELLLSVKTKSLVQAETAAPCASMSSPESPAHQAESELRAFVRTCQAAARRRPEHSAGSLVPYSRRGEMAIPAFKADPRRPGDKAAAREASLKLMRGAIRFQPDLFVYDLEDAAPDNPEFRPWAREFCAEALATLPFPPGQLRAFRPNSLRTPHFEDDLLGVLRQAGKFVDVIVLPKCLHAEDVADIQDIVRWARRAYGIAHKIWLQVLIEEAPAFAQAGRIAALEDVGALLFGALDFSGSIGGRVDPESWPVDLLYARQALPVIAAAQGKQAVDAVTGYLPITPRNTTGLDDAVFQRYCAMTAQEARAAGAPEPLCAQIAQRERALGYARRDAEAARRMGYAAKWILHPAQVEPIQGAWTPSREEALRTLRFTADYARSAERGSGAEVLHGTVELADKAVIRSAFWDLRHARRAGRISDDDIAATGYSWEQLERTASTRD